MRAQLGRYRLEQRLGGGGMGDVYLARLGGPAGFQREVALKVIRPELAATPRTTEMFLREGRQLAALHHRGIVQMYEMAQEDDALYIAMEYLRGVTLRELHRARAPLPWPLVLHVGAEIAHALGAAHALRTIEAPDGIVHGDLSPSNVMICDDGAVKVLDFGLARPAGVERSTSSVGGKLDYLPPEALSGTPADGRADLFALGVVLYELLTGELPFRGRNEMETIHRICHVDAAAPSQLRRDLPPALDAIVARALARDRGLRYEDAAAFAHALEAELKGQFGSAALAAVVRGLAGENGRVVTRPPRPVLDGPATASMPGRASPIARRTLAFVVALGIAGGAAAWLLRAPRATATATPAAPSPSPSPTELPSPTPSLSPPPTPPPSPTPAPTQRLRSSSSRPPRHAPAPRAATSSPVPTVDDDRPINPLHPAAP